MEYELPHLDDFDRYENGGMTALEVSEFRKRLEADKSLMAELELYQTLKTGIKSFHRTRLQGQMATFEAQFQARNIPFYKSIRFRKLSMAASVAAAIGVGVFVWKQTGNRQNNWQSAYIDEPGLPVLMSKNESAYNLAMNFYRQGQFTEAMNSLPASKSDTAAFYRGIFWLKLQNPDSAYRYLNPLQQQNTSAFRQRADYYSAMALWKAGKTDEAKVVFAKMAADPQHPFHETSETILKNGL